MRKALVELAIWLVQCPVLWWAMPTYCKVWAFMNSERIDNGGPLWL